MPNCSVRNTCYAGCRRPPDRATLARWETGQTEQVLVSLAGPLAGFFFAGLVVALVGKLSAAC